jgi:hypothetical protein
MKHLQVYFFENIGPDYLWRLRLIPMVIWKGERKYPPCNIFLHVFWRSDIDRSLHDHPWPSVSFLLWGKLREHCVADGDANLAGPSLVCMNRRIWPLLPYYRCARHRHRLLLFSKFAVTVFAIGFKQRSWGFWPNGKFVAWREHLGVDDTETID